MNRSMLTMAMLVAALAALGCGDDDGATGGGDGGTDADTDTDSDTDADGGATVGAIEVTGTYDGVQPDGVTFKVAAFACPFTMPPTYYDGSGTIDAATGAVHSLIEGVEPGEWCLMAYVDMNPDDGLQPVAGTDAVNATGDENANGAIPIDVVAGETTVVDVAFAI
jgi:hypothetical protein